MWDVLVYKWILPTKRGNKIDIGMERWNWVGEELGREIG
ncbi:hypothetical protein T07_12159 [Trichinella nelsoni]|uniref:Uncharacterized protein n=1 Tax=Trichinella nelsoni TaxID=6336 RepID=A0A0V0RA71_9BILA|nr:hypothetical protein T07_12159 [Trichinella nelsoni]